ncbi:hypothetical protein CKM354_000846700 [Cercospora kikuchii]|uniref:Uncharacterized protein n=1 Tax=Cercospora kikuchii TaxID=84275 RepID=A0A9P3CIY9_9PEZI|nr:uncharacterized protein CKM354_000846700 [Cercospora kikuchii]GIZ45294.1 hypothetical protein CKM354_000846700 [Cercospora kikuchii]
MSGRRQSGWSSHSAKSPSLATISEMEPPEGAPAQRPSERTSEETPTPEQRQLKRERYQLAGNAFAQQEFARRQMTPPTVIHPAFRPGFNLLDTTQPLPELDPSERLPHAEESPTMRSQFPMSSLETDRAATSGQMHRESTQTTLAQFMLNPPEIDLGTTPEHTPVPTQREWLETRDNLELHGGQQQHIPVIKHTPKSTAEEFASAVSTISQNEVPTEPHTPGPKSPKKTTFLERVTKWTARRTQTQLQKQKSDAGQAPDLPLPPKARAVLQHPPPARGLGRSPSKTKSFFSRRRSDANELPKPEPVRAATSLGHRTPRSVHFATPEPSAPQSRHVSGSSTAQRTSNLGRSQSLKYIDNAVPPTPPAKDTPPDEPPIRNMVQQRPAFAYETPIKPREYTSSGRLSPSRIGSNSSRGAAKLVTQPSMFSLRASVVPGAMDQAELDDANSRIGGLGIEGFSMPHETRRGSYTAAYSPSVYSPDDFRRSAAQFPERAATMSTTQQPGHLISSLRTPREVDRLEQMRQRGSPHTAQSSDSHMGTISMVYPDLAKDPSIASFMNMEPPPSPSPQPGMTDRAFDEVEKMLNTKDQQRTANLNVTPKAGLRGRASTSTRHVSEDSKDGLFAIPVERPQSFDETIPPAFSSKAVAHSTLNRQQTVASSPMAHHLSAVPSPLRNSDGQVYLPQTTFSPPKPRSRKESHLTATVPQIEEKASSETLLSPYDPPWTPGGRPKPKEDIFKNKPALAASTGDELVVRQSPPVGGMRWSNEAPATPGDPRKQSTRRKASAFESPWKVATTASEPQAPDKPLPEDPDDFHDLDDLIEMITERDSAIQDLQTEMKYENTRLHQRLASLEIKDREKKHGSRKISSAVQDEHKSSRAGKQSARVDDTKAKRISTSFAHEYYQNQTKTGPTSPADSVPMSERSTIILTPNMPQLGAIPDLPRPQEVPREDSPTLPPGSPNPVATPPVKKASESTPVSPSSANTDTRYNDLMAVMQQQQAMMLQMMQEIKDLKRSGQGSEN